MWHSVAELLITHARGGRESSLPPSRRSGPFLLCQPQVSKTRKQLQGKVVASQPRFMQGKRRRKDPLQSFGKRR